MPVAAIQIARPGNGSSAQARDLSGRLSSQVATAPSPIVSVDPSTATHMSGTYCSR